MTNTTDTTYNGWANKETWSVSLWINNDPEMYQFACDWVHSRVHSGNYSYDAFRHELESMFGDHNPDQVYWSDDTLDHAALTEMLTELAS